MPPPCTHLQSHAYPCVRVAVHATAFRPPPRMRAHSTPNALTPQTSHLTHAHTGVQSVLGNSHSILFGFHWRQPSPSKSRPSKPTPRRARMYHDNSPHAYRTHMHRFGLHTRTTHTRTQPHVRSEYNAHVSSSACALPPPPKGIHPSISTARPSTVTGQTFGLSICTPNPHPRQQFQPYPPHARVPTHRGPSNPSQLSVRSSQPQPQVPGGQ